MAEPATSFAELLIRSEIEAAVKGTFMAIINRGLELVADAHGLGLLLRGAEWVCTAAKWLQVGEGYREVDVEVPIPLGSGVELDLSAHARRSPSAAEPLITVCFAPVSGPDPGVLVVDGCQIGPGDEVDGEPADGHEEAALHAHDLEARKTGMRSAKDEGPVVLVNLDLSQLMSRERDTQIRAAALMRLARNQLVPALKQQRIWDDLEAAGVECVVCYDQETKDSIWLFLSAAEVRLVRAQITFDVAGRLMPWAI